MDPLPASNGHANPDINDKLQPSCVISSVLERIHREESWSDTNERVCFYEIELMEKVLILPYKYLQSKPGKNIRQQILASFNMWLQVPDAAIKIIADVIEMLHTGSLLYVPTDCAYE
jgi:hypothetical protein